MKDIKFIIAGNPGIGAPFTDVPERPDQKRISHLLAYAPIHAFENLIEFCIREKPDFLVLNADFIGEIPLDAKIRTQIENAFKNLAIENISVFLNAHFPFTLLPQELRELNISTPSSDKTESVPIIHDSQVVALISPYCFSSSHSAEKIFSHQKNAKNDCLDIGLASCNEFPPPFDKLNESGLDALFLTGEIQHKIWLKEPLVASPGCLCAHNPTETDQQGCLVIQARQEGPWVFDVEFKDLSPLQIQETTLDINGLASIRQLKEKILEHVSSIQKNASPDKTLIVLSLILTGENPLNIILRANTPALLLEDVLLPFSANRTPLIMPVIKLRCSSPHELPKPQNLIGTLTGMAQELEDDKSGLAAFCDERASAILKLPWPADFNLQQTEQDQSELINDAAQLCQFLLEGN